MRDESVAKIERSLAKIFTKYKYGRRGIGDGMALKRLLFYANLRISGCIFDGGARGWIQYFRQTNDERLINKLDWVVGNLRKRFLVPPDASLKTFTRAYWAVKHPGARHGNYVPNFDEWTVPQKRDLLIDLGVDRVQ